MTFSSFSVVQVVFWVLGRIHKSQGCLLDLKVLRKACSLSQTYTHKKHSGTFFFLFFHPSGRFLRIMRLNSLPESVSSDLSVTYVSLIKRHGAKNPHLGNSLFESH